jgi:hypothetical protein
VPPPPGLSGCKHPKKEIKNLNAAEGNIQHNLKKGFKQQKKTKKQIQAETSTTSVVLSTVDQRIN